MKLLKEENGLYAIDITNAKWATEQINQVYHDAGVGLKDVDFLIETKDNAMVAVEYKNANIPNAVRPDQFNPAEDKYVNAISQKFFDTLHYLYLNNIMRPVRYVYIVEYPKGDVVTRLRLKNRIRKGLPFQLQSSSEIKLIESFDVLSIKEWNESESFRAFPIIALEQIT